MVSLSSHLSERHNVGRLEQLRAACRSWRLPEYYDLSIFIGVSDKFLTDLEEMEARSSRIG